jgi:hypothetical protein
MAFRATAPCNEAGALLLKRVTPLVLVKPQSKPYTELRDPKKLGRLLRDHSP